MTAPQEPNNPSNLFTPFLPSTFNIPEEEDRLKTFLNDKLSAISDVVNDKKIGLYVQDSENFNGNKFFYRTTKITRNGYQAIAYFSTFVSGTFPLPIPNVNPQFRVTHVWGSASLPCSATGAGDGDYFSFMAQGDARISFTMSDLTLTITATAPMAAYSGFIIIEYLRDGE
jgi:hypothetical protein